MHETLNKEKRVKQLFTGMFSEKCKKIFDFYQTHETSLKTIAKYNSLHTGISKLSTQINTNSDTLEQISRKTKDLETSLIVNQDLIDNKFKSPKKRLKVEETF